MVERYVEQRGTVYYLRMRVPERFRAVETRPEINTSLKTRCPVEADERAALARANLRRDWEARLAGREAPGSRVAYEASIALLKDMALPYRRMEDLVTGPLEEILQRIEALADRPVESAAVPAVLGSLDLPKTRVSEMPAIHERVRADAVKPKTPHQLDSWRNKYLRGAAAFIKAVGDKPMIEITAQDARVLRSYWLKRRDEDGISTSYVTKQLNYMADMMDSYHSDLGLVRGDYVNVFDGIALEPTEAEKRAEKGRKLALPPNWISDTLLDPVAMAGLNDEARDIAIVCAETGARQNEIYNLPPEDIVLDHPIPHVRLIVVEEGEHRREIKNHASKRLVPLLGHALDAMRRHPAGFPRYRGKGIYSGAVNKHLKEAELFPEHDAGGREYTIGGLRHTYEDRMKYAGLSNEERGMMMGHSLAALRGRPVYGGEMSLQLRALLAEKVALPTATWSPRSHEVLDAEINRVLEVAGYRRS